MAYDADLADRLRRLLADEGVAEKRMFGGLAFLVGGHMGVAAGRDGGLLVRVDPAELEALVEEPGAERFSMGGRGPLKGWLLVRAEALGDDVLARWVERGVRAARSLPDD